MVLDNQNLNQTKITGIFLAAGFSQRFGTDKLLYPLPNGTPIMIAAARTLVNAIPNSLAVVRTESHARLLEREGLKIVINTQAKQGMASSIGCGIAATSSTTQGWVIALADMPMIQAKTIGLIYHMLCQHALIAVPVYQQQQGHPVGFQQKLRHELLSLTGDQGARSLLRRHNQHIHQITVDDPGILYDIDHIDDVEI